MKIAIHRLARSRLKKKDHTRSIGKDSEERIVVHVKANHPNKVSPKKKRRKFEESNRKDDQKQSKLYQT